MLTIMARVGPGDEAMKYNFVKINVSLTMQCAISNFFDAMSVGGDLLQRCTDVGKGEEGGPKQRVIKCT